jgi:PAS domain S-box-containing protein
MDPHGDFRLLAESIPNLAWIAHPDGAIYWYNRRWYEYTGTNFEQMQGWGWQSVHDPAMLPSVLLRWRAAIESGQPFEMTFPLKAANGTFRPFLTRIVPLKDDAGNILRWFGTNTDITAEHRALTALQRSEQRFRTATEAISGLLWTNNSQGQMTGEQPAWAAFTGQTPEQYRGYGWADAIHPDDAKPTLSAWQQAVREGHLFSVEHRVRRADGVYRLFSVRARPTRDENGAIREWVGIHTDITEERETQQALRRTVAALRSQEELVEAAQQSNRLGFWRYQPDKAELFLSSGARRLLSLPLTGEITLQQHLAHIHPDDRDAVRKALADAFDSGEYFQEFRTTPCPEATVCWVLGTARLLRQEDGSPYLVGMNLDITQQKRSADALIRTEKLAVAGRLAASIAHEINNPLEAVTNLLYLLNTTQLDEEQKSYCTTMTSELLRVSEIATHTLRFHRQSVRPGLTSIDALIASVLTLFDGRIRNAGIVTECRLAASGEIFAFDGELRQVLANLVGNAIDAMAGTAPPRILSIRTNQRCSRNGEPGIAITIADTGCGVEPSSLPHIFEPFFTTKEDIGTGLGLWVSSEIIRKHRGHIQVRSSQSQHSRGTTFRIFLPLEAMHPSS